MVGIVIDAGTDLVAAARAQAALDGEGVLALLVGPHGGRLSDGNHEVVLQRSYLTARSVELDALLVAAGGAPAADTAPALDAKAGGPAPGGVDPRLALLVGECWRHCKPLGAWGAGRRALAELLPHGRAGVVLEDAADRVLPQVLELLAQHRVWERFDAGWEV